MQKIKLLYDGSLLCRLDQNSNHRSGIFFVAYNVLIELLKNENLDVTLYCDLHSKFLLEKIIKTHREFKACNVITISKYDKIISKFGLLKYENKINKGNKIIRVFIKTILNIFLKLSEKEKINIEKLKQFNAYFSPRDKVPHFINNINKVKKYTIIYDIIPLKTKTKLAEKSWFTDLANSLNSTDNYFAISQYTKQDFLNYFEFLKPEQLSIIPLSTGNPCYHVNDIKVIEKVKEKYNIPLGKKYVFSLCALEPRKNIPFAIKNFIKFIQKHNINDYIFVLGGDSKGELYTALKKEIPDINTYKNKIITTGYVNDEDLSALYSGAELFIFPSLYEGFGLPVLEAMQCECPVITSNSSSLPEVIGEAGIQIDPTSDDELVQAIEQMVFNIDFKNICKEKGKERAKLFSWKNCADIIYERIKSGIENE